jgi:hypothetical protein
MQNSWSVPAPRETLCMNRVVAHATADMDSRVSRATVSDSMAAFDGVDIGSLAGAAQNLDGVVRAVVDVELDQHGTVSCEQPMSLPTASLSHTGTVTWHV